MDFKYQKICSNLLKGLPPRTNDVVERRFGLKNGERETLEFIGDSYGITRERVRQIEEEGLSKIKPRIKDCQEIIKSFNNILTSFGGVKKEDALLFVLGGEKHQNYVYFLLSLDNGFKRYSEDKEFHPFWVQGDESAEAAKKVVVLTVGRLEKEKRPFNLEELFKIQKNELLNILKKVNKDIFHSCLEISKKIQKNVESQIGLSGWVEINPRGVKDKAYLVLKKQGKPLHFTQVASLIDSFYSLQRSAHPATVHNELIKDQRFVLVGRGLYGLKEWGYEPGVVKDVILNVLKKSDKPLSKTEILKRVLEQRFVKENTVLLNLQDKNCFLKDSQGRYVVRES